MIKALLRGKRSVSDWCRTFCISRKTTCKWLRRFTEGWRRDLLIVRADHTGCHCGCGAMSRYTGCSRLKRPVRRHAHAKANGIVPPVGSKVITGLDHIKRWNKRFPPAGIVRVINACPAARFAGITQAGWAQRQVRSNGQIRWQGQKRFIGEDFVKHRLGLQPLKSQVHAVYFGPLLIGHLHNHDLGAMRPAVYHRHTKNSSKSKV